MIKYLRHRCNRLEDVRRYLPTYDGLECDLWLGHNNVLVQHHPVEQTFPPTLGEWWDAAADTTGARLVTYALNVKTNGLAPMLAPLLRGMSKHYFLFDVPGEEIEEYVELGLRVFARWSEYDYQQGYLSDLPGGVIDCFKGDYTLFPELLSGLPKDCVIAAIGEDLRNRPPLSTGRLEELGVQYLITKTEKP